MPVQFLLGRTGSGKTTHLLDEITRQTTNEPLGPPIYWLLPKQATFEAQRLLTARLGAFSRIRVVSFDLLGHDILTHCGDIDIPEVTAIGRRMVIGHLLRIHQKQLKFYSSSAHRPGLAAELDSTFGEFDRAGLDSPALDELLKDIGADDRTQPALIDKLSDLHLLLNAYNQFIGTVKLDPARRLSLIIKRVADCLLLRDAQIFVDDFYDFTVHERRLLTAVASVAPRTVISLLLDPDDPVIANPQGLLPDLSLFHRTQRTYRSLLAGFNAAAISVESALLLRGVHRYANEDLIAVEKHLFTNQPASAAPTSVESFDAGDLRGEVDAVARRIQSAVAGGLRYRQIGVLVRDLADYQQIVDASFNEHGLPYFADHRRTAGHHPLLQFVRSILLIVRHGWPLDAVMLLIKSGLAGLSDDQADELENYVLQHRIRGRMWEAREPWMFKRDLIVAEDEIGVPVLTETDRIDLYRRSLLEKLSPMLELGSKPRLIRHIATQLFATLENFGVGAKLLEWMNTAEAAGELERRGEHEQVWSEFVQMMDHLVELLGDQQIAMIDFISVLDAGLESFDLALTPPKADQILVGQIDRTRAPELKLVFVLGLNEGVFPRADKERCVITDRERRTLRARNIDLDDDTERRLLDEKFLAYLAFTRASQRLVLSRTTADSRGKEANASSFWQEMFRLLPGLVTQHADDDPVHIGTQRQLVTSLLGWVRTGADSPLMPALYQWLMSSQNPLRDQAWASLSYDNAASLEQATARQLFPSPLTTRVTQLETMAECPFRHFAKFGLRLKGRDEHEVTGIDLSNAYHDILENLLQDILQTRQDWCQVDPAEIRLMIRTHAAEIGRRLRGELMLSSSRNRYLLDRIERTLEQAVATMCEVNRRGKYRPTYAGLTFGEGETLPAYHVVTPNGEQVKLHGRIDRVDMNSKKAGFVVVDYKLTAGPLALQRVFYGLSLQLLTYLLVVQANAEQLVGRSLTPAAAFLMQLLRSPNPVDHPSEGLTPADPDFHLRVKPRGLVQSRAIASLDTGLDGGHSKVIGAYIKKDETAGNRHSTDVAEQAEFDALLLHVEQRLGELADQVFCGDVTVAPYLMGGLTPCPRCEYRSVCRFEPGINRYRVLPAMKREEVLTAVTKT